MPQFIRRALLTGILCATGCAAPRTFVETKEPDAKPPKATAAVSSKSPQRPTAIPKSAPNHPEPSMWSKWMEAFVPAKSKPTQRIPLPRTDTTSQRDGEDAAPPEPIEFSGF